MSITSGGPTGYQIEAEGAPSRAWAIALGGGMTLLGIILLFNIHAAVATLAILVGISLILSGVSEVLSTHQRTAGDWAAAAVLIAGGVAALVWPSATLWVLAFVTGVSLIIAGATRAALAVVSRHEVPSWPWLAALGVFGAAVGVCALVWPGATVVVLAVLLGLRMLMVGIAGIALALSMH